MWNCTHFRHPTDEQLRNSDMFRSHIYLKSVPFELRCSQKLVRYNNPGLYIESTFALCVNLKTLDLSFNTSITTIDFIKCMHSLKVLKGELRGKNEVFLNNWPIFAVCTSIDPVNMLRCLKQCKALVALDVSNCFQFSEDEHITCLVEVCKILQCLKVFKAEMDL